MSSLENKLTPTPSLIKIKFSLFFIGTTAMYSVVYAIFLKEQGMSEAQIGKIISISSIVSLFANAFIGYIADYFKKLRPILFVILVLNGIFIFAFTQVSSFVGFILISAGMRAFGNGAWSLLSPIILSIITGDKKAKKFALLRRYTSVGYMLSNLSAGKIAAIFSTSLLFTISAIASIIAAILALISGKDAIVKVVDKPKKSSSILLIKNKPYMIFIGFTIASGIWMPGAFQFLPAYSQELGISLPMIGIIMGVNGLLALLGLPIMGKWIDKFGVNAMLILAVSFLPIRSLLYAFADSSILIFVAQLTHFISFPILEVASILYFTKHINKENITSANGYFWSARILALIWSSWLAGSFIEAHGYKSWYFFAASISLVTSIFFIIYLIKLSKKEA